MKTNHDKTLISAPEGICVIDAVYRPVTPVMLGGMGQHSSKPCDDLVQGNPKHLTQVIQLKDNCSK